MKRKWKWIWLSAAVVAVAAGAGAYWKGRGPKPAAVQIEKVGRQDLQSKVSANGRIQAQKKVDISATIPGQVTSLAVQEGDRVRKGQFLLQIDPVNTRAAAKGSEASMQALLKDLDSARANLELSRVDLRRAEVNAKAGIVPEADLTRMKSTVQANEATVEAVSRRVEQARALLEGAQDTLAKTTVRAPMDGVVTAKRIEEGEVAVIGVQNQPGTVLLTISDMSAVEAEMEVDETSIPNVAVGQEARVRVDAYPNQTFDGVVSEVGTSPILPPGGVQAVTAIKFKVKIQIKDAPEGIKPGLSAQADVLTGFRPKALTVPIQALVVRDAERKPDDPPAAGPPKEEEGVFIVEGGKVAFRQLKTGLLGELAVEVVEGLKEGEEIVTGPFRELRKLKPGDLVEGKKPGEGGGEAPNG